MHAAHEKVCDEVNERNKETRINKNHFDERKDFIRSIRKLWDRFQ